MFFESPPWNGRTRECPDGFAWKHCWSSCLGSREALRFWNGYRTCRWAYIDLSAGIRRFVAYLDRLGVGSGERPVLWSDSRPEWAAVFWAWLAREVQLVPLDHHASPDFVDRIAMQITARLVVHSGPVACPTPPLEQFAIESLNARPEVARFSPTPACGNDVMEIVYTSGTTAEPKGVVHLHLNICASLDPIRQEIDRYTKWPCPSCRFGSSIFFRSAMCSGSPWVSSSLFCSTAQRPS